MSIYSNLENNGFATFIMDNCGLVTTHNFFSKIEIKNNVESNIAIISQILNEINDKDDVSPFLTNYTSETCSGKLYSIYKNTFADFYTQNKQNLNEVEITDILKRFAMKSRYQIIDNYMFAARRSIGKLTELEKIYAELFKMNSDTKLIAFVKTNDETQLSNPNIIVIKVVNGPTYEDGKWKVSEVSLDQLLDALNVTDKTIIASLKSKMTLV